MGKLSAFVSYRFRMFVEYVGLLDMFERHGLAVVNRSIDPWDPPTMPTPELIASMDMRIRVATHVIVLVGDDLADSPCCKLEIEIARHYGKPIIAVYPNGTFGSPIPRVLDGGLYRAIGWRGNALERAMRGEYPPESRVFDISEDVARRKGVALVGSLAAGAAILFAVQNEREVDLLRRELLASGLAVPEPVQGNITPWAIGGALGGVLVAALLGGRDGDLLVGAGIGAAMGLGTGKMAHARAELQRLGPLLEVRRPIVHGEYL